MAQDICERSARSVRRRFHVAYAACAVILGLAIAGMLNAEAANPPDPDVPAGDLGYFLRRYGVVSRS
jgi:hypothetical protein